MRCLDPLTVSPILARLALEFAVCDAWFSSVPGETWPNRNFAHAATSDDASDIELGFYYHPTIFEQLDAAGASWRIYHDGPAQAWCFRHLWREGSWLDRMLHRRPTIANWFPRDDFIAHAAAGDLPAYAFIEPTHLVTPAAAGTTNSQHPNNNRHGTADWFVGFASALRDSAVNDFVRKLALSRPPGSNPEPVVYKDERSKTSGPTCASPKTSRRSRAAC